MRDEKESFLECFLKGKRGLFEWLQNGNIFTFDYHSENLRVFQNSRKLTFSRHPEAVSRRISSF
jgi:hypothetical protein